LLAGSWRKGLDDGAWVAKGEGITVGCEYSGDAHRAKVGDFVGRFSLCVYGTRTGGEENEGNEGVDEDR